MNTLKIRVAAKKKPKRTTEELIEAAKLRDAKMDRSRKTPTELLKAAALLDAMVNYENIEKSAEADVDVETPKGEWDVKIGETIEFFDPNLSYELTGYRPITKDQGLDFDPKLFTEAADSFRKNGKYTMYSPGTFKNKLFWTREWDRCCNGCTIGKYRLTGQNYFWLNYYRLESNISTDADDDQVRVEDFPGFLAKQYEYFHYLELVKLLKKDALIFKARGVGVSEIAASNTVHQYTFRKGSSGLITAYIEDYVKTTLLKCWLQLSFLNMYTDGEFRHVRMKLDTDMHKRASKVDRDKNETGWMSDIKGITHDSPRKLRGLRVNSIVFEECFSPDTIVIMSDYSRKRIEDIKVGDFVMGIDGTPLEVVKTNSGYDNLYIVKLLKGEDYITTANHKLYLESTSENRIELLTPIEYLQLSEYDKETLYGLKSSALYFNSSSDPYFLGPNITNDKSSNSLSTPIKIEDYEYGKYCGITLKSYGKETDNLFLLNDYTIVHNCGSDPVLEKTYIQAEALVRVGGKRIGSRYLQGTGGDSGEALAALNKMFYNPEGFKILPYKNTYGQDGQVQYTGYFIPSYTMWFGDDEGNVGFDERGVVDEEMAKRHFTKEFEKYEDPHALLISRAEYCFTPEDAFILEGSNRFDQELLVELYNNITIHKVIPGPQSAKLSWNISTETGGVDKLKRPKIEFITDGPLKIIEPPKLDQDGNVYSNLYVAGCDAIDVDSTTSTGLTDVSKFCVIIYRRSFGIDPPKPVAIYIERPQHIQTAFDNALKLCSFYNAKMLVEATRISIKLYFEKEHMLHYLMKRPQSTANSSKKTNFRLYGVPATEAIIQHLLDLIELYIVDYSTEIQFPELLNELIKYSYENKRKFDMVAAFGIALLADEDMLGKVAMSMGINKDDYINLSYYRNEYGLLEFGIPEKSDVRIENLRDDLWSLW